MSQRNLPLRVFGMMAGMAIGGHFAQESNGQTLVQDGGPIIIGQDKPRFEKFVLERLSASLELLAQYQNDEHDPDRGETISEKETLFREELEISTDSYIGHPNLIDLKADVRFRLEQENIDSNAPDAEGDHESYLTLFDVNALILRESKLPWTVYARRDETRINRTFAGTLRATITEYGTNVSVRSDRMPSRFSYFHRDQEQDGSGGWSDFNLTQDTFYAESDLIISRQQSLAVDYTYDSIDQSSQSVSSWTDHRHDLNAIHTLKFGSDLKNNLRSSMKYLDRDSNSRMTRFRWDELLQLEHTRRLRTRFDTLYEDRTQNGLNQTFMRGAGQIRHKLFQSLTTTFTAGGSRNELDHSLDNESIFAHVFFDYTKRVPYGRLDAGTSVGVVDQRNGERGETVRVDNDRRVFNDPFPIIINRRNIVTGSIVVSDAADVRVFGEGIDYTLQVFTDRTEIRRIVGGAIADGETVLIDYSIGPEPSSDVFTTTTSISVRYTFNEGRLTGLGAYARLNTVNQNVDTSDRSVFTFEDRTFAEYGVDYRYKGLYLAFERQQMWSDFSPFESTRVEGVYTHQIGRRSMLSFESNYSVVDFKDEDNRVELARIRGIWTQRLNPSLDFDVRLTYRDEKDDLAGDSTGFEQQFEMRWHRNQTDIVINASNSFLNSETADNTFQLFSVGLRRSF